MYKGKILYKNWLSQLTQTSKQVSFHHEAWNQFKISISITVWTKGAGFPNTVLKCGQWEQEAIKISKENFYSPSIVLSLTAELNIVFTDLWEKWERDQRDALLDLPAVV